MMVNTIDVVKRVLTPTFGKEVAISSAWVGGVFYMGRSYLKINPLHAALFSVVANIVVAVAAELIRVKERRPIVKKELFIRSAALLTIAHLPHALAIVSGALSSLQVLTIMGVEVLFARILLVPKKIASP